MARANFRSPSFRKILWQWHRRLGLVAALFVLLLAVTGIFLNHTDSLELNSAALPGSLRSLFYAIESPSLSSIAVSGRWLSQAAGNGELYLDDTPLTQCQGPLVGALQRSGLALVACGQELLLFSSDWQLVERVGEYQQLPTPLNQLGHCGALPCFQVSYDVGATEVFELDLERLAWSPLGEGSQPQWVILQEVPAAVRVAIEQKHLGASISWERLLLDLHSGRFLGPWGPLLMDLMALLFIVLALTGITAWWAFSRSPPR